MIPGPIEVSDDVLLANAHPSMAHVSPQFVPVFQEALNMFRDVVGSKRAQPLIVAGSGTLGWDMVAANVVEAGEEVLVVHTGFFADGFADAISAYGGKPTQVKAPVGSRPSLEQIKAALQSRKFKAITITHVDTSTAVLNDVKAIAELVRSVSPETLIVVDGVCSVASEELEMDAWDLDVVLTASQKGIGCPPGLSLLAISPRALEVFEKRQSPPPTYYASWTRWLPVMRAYQSGSPAYFGTPPTNLIYALHQSLKTILHGPASLAERVQRHKEASDKIKAAVHELGLKQLVNEELQRSNGDAHTMTAVRYPQGLSAGYILPKLAARDVVLGAGLHKECKDEYFRIGHMGVSVMDPKRGDLDKVITALREVLQENGVKN